MNALWYRGTRSRRRRDPRGDELAASSLDAIDELIADPPAGPDADLPATTAVDRMNSKRKHIRKAHRELAELPEGSHEWSEQLHTIRKRAKPLRYSTDAAEPLQKKKYKQISKTAKDLQSALGDYNDSRINRARLAELAASGRVVGQDDPVVSSQSTPVNRPTKQAIAAYGKAAKDL